MKSLKSIINEKLKLNKQTKTIDTFLDRKKIKVDISNSCWFDKRYIEEITDFAETLGIKPYIISNKSRKPGERWMHGTNSLNMYYEKSYEPKTYIHFIYIDNNGSKPYWRYSLMFESNFIDGRTTYNSLTELLELLKKDIDKTGFFKKINPDYVE